MGKHLNVILSLPPTPLCTLALRIYVNHVSQYIQSPNASSPQPMYYFQKFRDLY